jgi:hypothetical protein
LLSDPVAVRGRLALLGWPSLSAWAKAHGFCRNHTRYVVTTWGQPRPSGRRAPYGGVTLAIAHELTSTLIEQRRPDGELEF